MRKRFLSLCILSFLSFGVSHSQEKADFKPSGKMILRGFAELHSGLNNNKRMAFDISRAYLGYEHTFTPNLKATIIGDFAAGKSSDGKLEPALKNAFIQWKKNNFTIKSGIIGLYQFKEQEYYWGHRYLYKSFQDKYKLGHSADVGLSLKYQFNSQLSADFSMVNGEGYKKIRQDKSLRYALGLSASPTKHWKLRIYADIYNDNRENHPDNSPTDKFTTHQYTYAAFIGYKNKYVKAGAEYNRQIHPQWTKDINLSGYSVYCTIDLCKNWHTFARFDWLQSYGKNKQIRNGQDGKTAILGVEYQPYKNIKIAPNIRYLHNDKSQSNDYEAYISLEFRI